EADVLNGVAWLKTIRSQSVPGLSSITLLFQPGTNLLKARQMVQERLSVPAAIPNVSKAPIMLPPTSSTSRTMMIGLSPSADNKLSLIDMGVLARWTIRPRLMGVPGDAIVDGKPGLMLVVEKLPNAHTLEVTKGVEEALADLKPGLTGMTIDSSIFRPAGFIHHAVHDLGISLLIGFGLLLLALALLF